MDSAAIIVDDLHKHFGEVEVLRGVSLSAAAGEVVTLIGRSGAGKSTFLRCLNFLEQPTSGRITIGDHVFDVDDLTRHHRRRVTLLRRELGMVFQSFNLWPHRTALENIIEGPVQVLKRPRVEAVETARALLDKVGLSDRADFYPDHLSGGQQQRVAIARALAMEPKVLLFDEPTSSLDPELVGDVLAVMTDLAAEGRTMLVVTHEMRFAREVSSRVAYMEAGRVAEIGPPEAIFGRPQHPGLATFVASVLQR